MALVEDQMSVVLPPLGTMLGFEPIVIMGGGAAPVETVMVADWLALPPVPVHVNTYLAVALIGPVVCEPFVATDPLHDPEAVHAVALVEFHARVVDWPLATAVGLGVKVTVG